MSRGRLSWLLVRFWAHVNLVVLHCSFVAYCMPQYCTCVCRFSYKHTRSCWYLLTLSHSLPFTVVSMQSSAGSDAEAHQLSSSRTPEGNFNRSFVVACTHLQNSCRIYTSVYWLRMRVRMLIFTSYLLLCLRQQWATEALCCWVFCPSPSVQCPSVNTFCVTRQLFI